MATFGIVMAILPIGAVITALSREVLNTAIAAQDVLVEKESFKTLSKYLGDIHVVLSDLQRRNLHDSPAMRRALDYMRAKVTDAQNVIDSMTGKSRFLLLIRSRSIVRNAQSVTRGIGDALQLLLTAGVEVAVDIGEHAHRLKETMVSAEFQASAEHARVMSTLERGLSEHKTDRGFANDILREIALAMDLETEGADLRSELASFKREVEEVSLRKLEQEKAFMDQVIAVLYRAEAVSPPEDPDSKYRKLAQKADCTKHNPPYPSFICHLTQRVMGEPVILGGSENTYERSALLKHLENRKTDPRTGTVLTKIELRPNNGLRESIEEWEALNNILRIRAAKERLLSRAILKQTDALEDIRELCQERAEYKYWIAAEGILEAIVEFLGSSSQASKDFRELSLVTVTMIITDDDRAKERFVDAGGLKPLLKCLNKRYHLSTAANLLMELSKNKKVCDSIPTILGSLLSLVTVYFQNENNPNVHEKVKFVLEQLSDNDDNIEKMAMANWCEPLVKRLATGPESSKMCMADFLADTNECDVSAYNKLLLAERALAHLVAMLKSRRVELEMAALGALSNLSSWKQIKCRFAASGAVPVVLEVLASPKYTLDMRERAAFVLANLCSEDGVEYLVDVDGESKNLALRRVVEPLLKVQDSCSSFMRIYVLRALAGMAKDEEARTLIRRGRGIPLLLTQAWGSNREVRSCALRALWRLSEDKCGVEIADQLQQAKTEAHLVKLLEDVDSDAQAAVGILANLPLERQKLKSSFLAAGVVTALVALIRSGGRDDAQANAVEALRRFTEPSDLEIQKAVANLDIIPMFVELLGSASPFTQARAAQVLRNFSLSTSKLIAERESLGGWMCFMKTRPSICRVHKGKCSVKGTFCLVEAEAVGPLVSLLQTDVVEVAEASVAALETLVAEDDFAQSGAVVLHEVHGIQPLFRLLSCGNCADRAVQLLEHIFKVPGMKELYRRHAGVPLKLLAATPNTPLSKKAARLLASMEKGR